MSGTSAPAASTSGKDVFQKRMGYTPTLEKQRRESESMGTGTGQPSRKSTGKMLKPLEGPSSTSTKSKNAESASSGQGVPAAQEHTAIDMPSSTERDGLDALEPRESYVPRRDSNINFVKPSDTVYTEDDADDDDDFVHLQKKKASAPVVRDSAVGLIWNSDGQQLGVITGTQCETKYGSKRRRAPHLASPRMHAPSRTESLTRMCFHLVMFCTDYTNLSASSLFKSSAATSKQIRAQRKKMKTAKVTAIQAPEKSPAPPAPPAQAWDVFAGYFSKDQYIVLTIFILALTVLIETTVIAFLSLKSS